MSSAHYAAKAYANKVTRQRDALLRAMREIHDDANALSWLEVKEKAAAAIAAATKEST